MAVFGTGDEQSSPVFVCVRSFQPSIDLYDRGDELVRRARLPGVRPSGVDRTLESNMLTITGRVDYRLSKDEGRPWPSIGKRLEPASSVKP